MTKDELFKAWVDEVGRLNAEHEETNNALYDENGELIQDCANAVEQLYQTDLQHIIGE